MNLLYTRRYKLNLIFSLIVSFFLAVIAAGIMSKLPDGRTLAYDLRSVAGASVFVFSNLYFTRKYRRRRKILLTDFPDGWIEILEKYVPFYSLLNEDDKYIFQKKIQLFLSGVLITGVGMEIDDVTRVLVGAGAAIPVFKVLDWEYTMITDIFVCPDKFNEYFAMACRETDILGLVVHNNSAVYLSKESLIRGFSKTDGNNTGIHEFMHKIDEGSGDIDGILPSPFLSKKERSEWLEIVDKEMERIKRSDSLLRPYALTNRAEFIAVAAEFFFERPLEMKKNHPKLYNIMQRVFRQNLSAAVVKEARNLFKR
ncbi:MAG TPA: zinc-dependent peptidase [Spirochaetota bacterium]|nr:zinc-dependent peptidase [Spirochaetota bacterium]